jgi:hypothetical protein
MVITRKCQSWISLGLLAEVKDNDDREIEVW